MRSPRGHGCSPGVDVVGGVGGGGGGGAGSGGSGGSGGGGGSEGVGVGVGAPIDVHNRFARYQTPSAPSTPSSPSFSPSGENGSSGSGGKGGSGVVGNGVGSVGAGCVGVGGVGSYTHSSSPTVFHVCVPGYVPDFVVDLGALLSTQEWCAAVLFAHLSSAVVLKIINLLLMEKSLIIHGRNAGIVTSVTMAVINLIAPFRYRY
ncbi:hypothetical protein B484DRAFT_34458 [Ochromonadaceae sp. CCMP2298]|nr:hypothetical protein B484DRAFT_34458 [Ochromonadaceae sp. CCMP2298]